MRTPTLFALALTCLLGLATPGHAAPTKVAAQPKLNHGFVRYEDEDAKQKEVTDGCTGAPGFRTAIYVECLNEDRPKFDALIQRDYPGARVLYTAVNQHVPEDMRLLIESGVRQYYVRGKYEKLVLISSFRRPTLGFVGETASGAYKRYLGYFTSAQEEDGPRLILLSTQKEPPTNYLNLVKASGGSYRALKLDSNGNFN